MLTCVPPTFAIIVSTKLICGEAIWIELVLLALTFVELIFVLWNMLFLLRLILGKLTLTTDRSVEV